MASLFIAYRYVVFVLFVLCSVITISIAGWNLSLAQKLRLSSSYTAVDGFLIFVGALGTVCLFPIMLIDLLRKNALTSQVRFESALMCVFWLLQIIGAAAMTITSVNSTVVCIPGSLQTQLEYCTSSRVLLTFSWIAAVNSLIYFCTLMVLTIMRYTEDQQIWKASTLEYPWFGSREPLGSAPVQPPKTGKKPFVMSASFPGGRAGRTSFAARMFMGKQQVPDLEKQMQQQPSSAAMPQPTVVRTQQHARQASNEPRPSLTNPRPAPRPAPAPTPSRGTFDHSRTASTDSASSSGSSSSGYSSDYTPLSPAKNPRHTRGKRSLHLHRPPPLNLTVATAFRAAPQPADAQR